MLGRCHPASCPSLSLVLVSWLAVREIMILRDVNWGRSAALSQQINLMDSSIRSRLVSVSLRPVELKKGLLC
jgi:hypothetical protein